MTVKPSACNRSSATYCGATQIFGVFVKLTVVVSGGRSTASACLKRTSPAAPASDTVVRKRRRVGIIVMASLASRSRLQLAFELVEEAPIRALGDDLVGARLDQTGLMQTERIEPQRVFGVVFAPLLVRDVTQGLQSVIVVFGEATADDPPRRAVRLGGAEIGRL